MIVFINSVCNLTCEHCFYWKNLNRRDDLSYAEFETLSRELGTFENLNLSGGEPFMRKDLAEIIRLACIYLKPRLIHIPTNALAPPFIDKTTRKILDYMEEFSDPSVPISSPRKAFCSDSWKVRPIAITSPTDFICVVNLESACGNFSKVKRGIFVTT